MDNISISLSTLNKLIVIMLLLAVMPLPYSYYFFLRWTVTLSAGIFVYFSFRSKSWAILAIFSVIGVLFNPLEPIYLNKNIWVFVDLLSAALFAFGYAELQNKSNKIAAVD